MFHILKNNLSTYMKMNIYSYAFKPIMFLWSKMDEKYSYHLLLQTIEL